VNEDVQRWSVPTHVSPTRAREEGPLCDSAGERGCGVRGQRISSTARFSGKFVIEVVLVIVFRDSLAGFFDSLASPLEVGFFGIRLLFFEAAR
jgi:hypothetical protein